MALINYKQFSKILVLTDKTLKKRTCSNILRQYSKSMNLVSKLFQPINLIPKDAHLKPEEITSKSHKLLLDFGIIRQASPGTFSLLPLGERSLQKLVRIVDREMQAVGGQKIFLPSITSGELWKTTGRWNSAGAELFKLQDRHGKDLVLSPTHEEAVTSLVSSLGLISYRQLPLLLYQVSAKFRDEVKPRSGLLRAREFLMKDMYSFDTSLTAAMETYEVMKKTYEKIFSLLGVKFLKVKGDASSMGGSASEEFHLLAEVGEDRLWLCESCGEGYNSEMLSEDEPTCPACHNSQMQPANGIEVGHCFVLGTRYSEPLKANFLHSSGKPEVLQMGCYGLGLTRILAATAECLSSWEELRWPRLLAPYSVCIVTPKNGSKEADALEKGIELYKTLDQCPELNGDILLDDRGKMTIGRRAREAQQTGYSYVVVAGKSSLGPTPTFEVMDSLSGEKRYLCLTETVELIRRSCAGHKES